MLNLKSHRMNIAIYNPETGKVLQGEIIQEQDLEERTVYWDAKGYAVTMEQCIASNPTEYNAEGLSINEKHLYFINGVYQYL